MSTHQMHQVEALCNRIVLINQGTSMLYGEVNQLKRHFAGNRIRLEGEGDFSEIPDVVALHGQDGVWHMTLEAGTDPQQVLQTLISRRGVKITRFALAEPSLEEIFVTVVRGKSALPADPAPGSFRQVSDG
jgi:ABC-2 type transport system ATP-binding protein